MSYTIKKIKNKFYIMLNSVIPTWQSGFSCIECAEQFADAHDIDNATDYDIKYSADDFEWIADNFGFRYDKDSDIWFVQKEDKFITLKPDIYTLVLTVNSRNESQVYTNTSEIINVLSNLFDDDIFSSIMLTSISDRLSIITAASSRDIAKKLVRVKSSNLWSYGINIKRAGDKFGDVVVQFKGKQGGPTGGLYIYYDVPIVLWRKWITAPSKGHFFWVHIRNNFKYSRLDGDKRTYLPNGINQR